MTVCPSSPWEEVFFLADEDQGFISQIYQSLVDTMLLVNHHLANLRGILK